MHRRVVLLSKYCSSKALCYVNSSKHQPDETAFIYNPHLVSMCYFCLCYYARLSSDVPANSILRICAKTRDGERPSQEWRRTCGRPSTTWVHQICRDTGVSATEALLLAEDKPFWRTIATAGGSG